MEEFKNLKEIIELSEEEINNNDENVSAILDLVDLKELRNLVTRYKELEEENIHWKGQYHLLSRKIDVIPKSKVKEKIEEIKKLMLKENESIEQFYKLKYCYEILQELLED